MACKEGQGPQLTRDQLEAAAKAGGFTGEEIRLAAAVAWAESGGCLHAMGDAGRSHGLWQIHHPSWNEHINASLSNDPTVQARAAYAISRTSRGWNHWTMYRNKKYQLYYRGGYLPSEPGGFSPDTEGPALGGPGSDVFEKLGDVVDLMGKALTAITDPKILFQAGKIMIGWFLVLYAGNAIIKDLTGVNIGGKMWEGTKTVGGAVIGGATGGPAGAAAGAAAGAQA